MIYFPMLVPIHIWLWLSFMLVGSQFKQSSVTLTSENLCSFNFGGMNTLLSIADLYNGRTALFSE